MTYIDAPYIKRSCCTLSVSNCGRTFLFKHPKGKLLAYPYRDPQGHPFAWMENTNTSCTKAGMFCAIIPCDPTLFDNESFISHQVCLLMGLFEHPLKGFQFCYHKWKDVQEIRPLDGLISQADCNTVLIHTLFEQTPSFCDAKGCYVMYFNQICGPVHQAWHSGVNIGCTKDDKYHLESTLDGDHWTQNRYLPGTLACKLNFLRFKSHTRFMQDVYLPRYHNRTAKLSGVHKLAKHKSLTKMALYCKQVIHDDLKDYFFQPVPTLRQEDYQLFALLSTKQCKELDSLIKGRGGSISSEEFHLKLVEYSVLNNKPFIPLRRMKVFDGTTTFRYSVSVVERWFSNDNNDLKVYGRLPSGQPYIWCVELANEVYDYDLPHGFVIGHFYPSIIAKLITPPMIFLDQSIFAWKGSCTLNHQTFWIILCSRY